MYTNITDVLTKFLHVVSLHYVVQASFGNSADCSEMWRRVVYTYLATFRRILLPSPSDTLKTETTMAWKQRVLQNWRIKAKDRQARRTILQQAKAHLEP
jgi:hypothetical protein